MKTGLSRLRALCSDTNSIADAPSHGAEQSSSLIGEAIFFEFITSCKATSFPKRARGFLVAFLWFLTETIAICCSVVPYLLMWAFANIAAQCTGNIKAPRVTSHNSLLPGLSTFSAPTTSTVLHKPDAINAKAEATVLVPELQRLSMRCEILGCIPSISDIIAELYWSVAHVENKTASISFAEMPLSLISCTEGSQASSNKDIFEPLVNVEVAHADTATLCILEGC